MIPEQPELSPAGLLKLAGFAMGLFAVQTFWGFTWATLPLYLKEPPAKRFIFLGLIMTIGEKFEKNQGNNDDI